MDTGHGDRTYRIYKTQEYTGEKKRRRRRRLLYILFLYYYLYFLYNTYFVLYKNINNNIKIKNVPKVRKVRKHNISETLIHYEDLHYLQDTEDIQDIGSTRETLIWLNIIY